MADSKVKLKLKIKGKNLRDVLTKLKAVKATSKKAS